MSTAQPFVIERIYNAPASKIWEALTEKEKMKEWYFNIAEFEPVVGFEFTFEGSNKGHVFVHLCKITEIVPGKKIAYTWQYKDVEGMSTVSIELFPENGKTRLKLVHEGLETFPPTEHYALINFEKGWTWIIGTSLPKYLGEPIETK